MPTIFELKEQAVTETPLLLFDCVLTDGRIERWSTHRVQSAGHTYAARVQRHNVFEIQAASDQGVEGVPKISLTLANADSQLSQTEHHGQKFIYVPYTGQTNDAGMLAWNREADYFLQMIKDQFDTLYREGAENGRVMCLSLHPHNIGRPNAAKHLDEALSYILGHAGVWNTTADDIAEYYIANYYDQVTSWIADRKAPG